MDKRSQQFQTAPGRLQEDKEEEEEEVGELKTPGLEDGGSTPPNCSHYPLESSRGAFLGNCLGVEKQSKCTG